MVTVRLILSEGVEKDIPLDAYNDDDGACQNPYADALNIQDACNLSGVAHRFSDVASILWNEARAVGLGTDYVNTHPVARLFIDKLLSLSGLGNADSSIFRDYETCRVRSAVIVEAGKPAKEATPA